VIVDLASSPGAEMAAELGGAFAVADVTDEVSMKAAVDLAESLGPVRVLVHCAGRGGALRILEKDGSPGSLAHYEAIIKVNLTGSFNALRLAAAAMARTKPLESGERGVVVLTASIAGYEGQIGQIPYASSKAGVIGMALVAARDLASKLIRVCTIAPGIMDTPMLARLPDNVKQSLGASVPNPARLGRPEEYAALAMHIVENAYLNGETIRIDGALRMAPR
jgi:NAD(P)-dependent dehydrogenase (short-subunit alcohol dehydrogenase family)